MTAPTLSAVLREAAALLAGPTLPQVHAAIRTAVAADAACPDWPADQAMVEQVAERTWDLFVSYEADAGWPRFRTVDGMAAHLSTAAAAVEVELAHLRRRHAIDTCQSCGRSGDALCRACLAPLSADADRLTSAIHDDTTGSAR